MINQQIPIQPQQSQCNPDICLKCGKRFYCAKWTQYLENYVLGAQNTIQQPQQIQQVQQPTQQMQVQQDISPLLDVVENLQKQVTIMADKLNLIESDKPNFGSPLQNIQNEEITLVDQNTEIGQINDNTDLQESQVENNLVETTGENGIAVYTIDKTPGMVLVEKKGIFGKKWVEEKVKEDK